MKFFALITAILLLAACTPQDSTPIFPTAVVTPNIPPQAVPLDLSGIAPENYRITYNDPSSGEFKTLSGEGLYSPIANLNSGFVMTLNANTSDADSAFVVFAFPEDIAPGTYHLIEYNAAFTPDNLTILTVGATLAGVANYFEVHEGAVTITAVNPLTGAFQFSGIAELDGDKTAQVVVNGAFNALPFIETRPGK